MKANTPQSVIDHLAIDPATGCAIWTGAKNIKGYGRARIAGRLVLPHRVAYELAKGPIPPGLEIDHLCRNRACCNAAHLEAVTHKENVSRGTSPSVANSSKTLCSRGHPLAGANLYMHPSGRRQCIACMRRSQRAWQDRKRLQSLINRPSGASSRDELDD